MIKRIRTKKNRKYRKKNKSFKFGGAVDISSPSPSSDDNSIDELTQKIKAEHSLGNFLPNFNLGDSKVLKKVVELSEGLMMKTIDNTAAYFNVDLNDSEQFKRRLEAAEPFMNKLISDIFEKLTIMGNEFGEAGIKIGLNTLEEIPGYGVIIGTIRSVSNAAEAVIASSNTASEIMTIAADTTNASIQTFDKLLKEKGDLLNRTTESINKFSESMKSMPNNMPAPALVTGGSRKHKKGYNKTKKVRFNF